jgi:hypothetical protein
MIVTPSDQPASAPAQREPEQTDEQQKRADLLLVSTVLRDIEIWLDQAKRIVAGPVDITCMALGTVLIAFAIWGRILNSRTWSAPEFLGLISVAALLFIVAFAEHALIESGHRQEAELERIKQELESLRRAGSDE